MYVCICNAVTETDIKNAVKEGANCMHHLQSKLGASSQCGSCACDVSACLDRALEKQMQSADLFTL